MLRNAHLNCVHSDNAPPELRGNVSLGFANVFPATSKHVGSHVNSIVRT